MDSRVKIKNKDNISQAEANVKAKLAHFSYHFNISLFHYHDKWDICALLQGIFFK